MADPASLAGTAIGVISLGVQVLGGLYEYATAAQGRTKELTAASQQIQHIIATFRALESTIARIAALPHHDKLALTTLRQCVDDIKSHVTAVESFLREYEKPGPGANDMKGKTKDVARKLAFPLHEKKLKRLGEHISSRNFKNPFSPLECLIGLGMLISRPPTR